MFSSRFWTPRMFDARFWAATGADAFVVTGLTAARLNYFLATEISYEVASRLNYYLGVSQTDGS